MERRDFLLAIRIQGRGGQGAQTAGEILAAAFQYPYLQNYRKIPY